MFRGGLSYVWLQDHLLRSTPSPSPITISPFALQATTRLPTKQAFVVDSDSVRKEMLT